MAHPDLPAEQAYLDHAYDCLERMREALLRTVNAAGIGGEGADIAVGRVEAWVDRRLATYEAAEQILCFGRIDVDSVEDPLYVGRRWVHDDEGVAGRQLAGACRAPVLHGDAGRASRRHPPASLPPQGPDTHRHQR